MSLTGRVDVEQIRAAHPIEGVVAASGVELIPRGRGYMACCPFHDDSTASMSVGGVPGRFHCFGCGAGGDVIDFVRRQRGLGFTEAVHALEHDSPAPPFPARVPRSSPARRFTTTAERVIEINELAWRHFTTVGAVERARAYLRDERGIDVTHLRGASGGAPVAGYAPATWTDLTSHLRTQGVTDQELLDADLAQTSRQGRVIDTLLDRLVLPVRDPNGRVRGFIGRDLTGDRRAPKYRNPTRTPAFDKATVLYRPTVRQPSPDATVVIVEGALDALALAVHAAVNGQSERFVPCTTSGVTVSRAPAVQVLALHPRPPVIALDGDTAGAEGTARWVRALCLDRHRPALVTRLPHGLDPADWLHAQGAAGLAAFDRATCLTAGAEEVAPHLPGREIVRLCFDSEQEPIHLAISAISAMIPLALRLPTRATQQLVAGASREMSMRGWNPDDAFAHARGSAIEQTRRRRHDAQPAPPTPKPFEPEPGVHSFDLAR
jgi:DNA primase